MDRRIARILGDLFGVVPARCTDSLSPEHVKGWDSIGHMTLVLTLEQTFGVELCRRRYRNSPMSEKSSGCY